LVLNITLGGLLGYSSVKSSVNLKVPSSQGVSSGPIRTAYQLMMLVSEGAAIIESSL